MNSIHIYLKKIPLVLIIFLSFNPHSFSQSIDSLVGNWTLIKNARQWDVSLIFHENKSFFVQRHLSAEYDYQLKGDTLVSFLHHSYPDSETVVDTSLVTVKTDTIVRTYTKGGNTNFIKMIRDKSYKVPASKNHDPLTGRWKWEYPSKDTAYETFHNDKTWDFSVTGKPNSGHYEVNKDTLTMIYDDVKNTKRIHTFWIEGGMMGIRDVKTGKEYLYRRTKQ